MPEICEWCDGGGCDECGFTGEVGGATAGSPAQNTASSPKPGGDGEDDWGDSGDAMDFDEDAIWSVFQVVLCSCLGDFRFPTKPRFLFVCFMVRHAALHRPIASPN